MLLPYFNARNSLAHQLSNPSGVKIGCLIRFSTEGKEALVVAKYKISMINVLFYEEEMLPATFSKKACIWR